MCVLVCVEMRGMRGCDCVCVGSSVCVWMCAFMCVCVCVCVFALSVSLCVYGAVGLSVCVRERV